MVTSTGRSVYWAPPVQPIQLVQVGTGNDNLRVLNGVAPYPRMTAGWSFTGGMIHPRVWIDRTGGFAELGAEPIAGTGVPLYSVSMPRADLAYICGNEGRVLLFDGGSLVRLPAPSPPSDLSSIVAFDEQHVYVAGGDAGVSWVWSWNGAGWTPVMRFDGDAGGVRALGGTAPDDLWAAGKSNAWHLSFPP
jgi:hypothetical protein